MTGSDPSGPLKRAEIILSGRVQGVGFRYFTRRRAAELGIAGWVRNLADGDVQVIAQGPADTLNDFISRLREGPPVATVLDVDIQYREVEPELDGFEVRPTSYR